MKKRKALGQHYLISPDIIEKILVAIDPSKKDFIIEIGAGKGALTFALAEKAGMVIAIEKDRTLIPILKSKETPNLKIIDGDVLNIEFKQFIKKEQIKLVGNLPYSISSPILFKTLEEKELISECFFVLQKEVAERICAKPGTKKYAPLSILIQNHFYSRLLFSVSPESFYPSPKVDSDLILLKKRKSPQFSVENEELFWKFLKGTFRHRRKKLSNNLKRLDFPDSSVNEAISKCGLNEDIRPEQVFLSQFVRLFNYLYHLYSNPEKNIF